MQMQNNYNYDDVLKQQYNKNFVLWLSFRPQDENNPLVDELRTWIHANLGPAHCSFHGLMYWDDKFTTGLKNRLLNVGRIVRQGMRTGQWRTLFSSLRELLEDRNGTLVERIGKSLPPIRSNSSSSIVMLTRLDSDDLLHERAIEDIQQNPINLGARIFQNGYIYNAQTNELAYYKPSENPPFHTIVFPDTVFYNPELHAEYYGGFRSHEDVPKVLPARRLPDGRYCVVIHEKRDHISTVWEHPYRGKFIEGQEKADVLQALGL